RMIDTTQGRAWDPVGPFARGFRLPERAKRIAVVGRGIGIAALPSLVDEAAARGIDVHGFLSARTRPNLVALDIFASYGFPVSTHTDDASSGLVTDHLVALAEKRDFDAFYVCGSNRLARAVHPLAARTGAPAEIAVGQHMARGFRARPRRAVRGNPDARGPPEAVRARSPHRPRVRT